MGFEVNEISVNSRGGTELLRMELEQRIPPELVEDFQIICSRVRKFEEDKIRVLWLHDLPEDPESSHLKVKANREKFQKLVFTSNWQYNRYRDVLGVPHNDSCAVIENGVIPFDVNSLIKSKEEIRLIYSSTPQRGLELLVPVFIELCKKHDNIVLDVFSSFKIYGWADSDKPYEKLFETCRNHPKINYHGNQPNEVVREALTKAHIHAYPSIWPETSCRSVIEAMSAGLLCVHPNFGALPDTSGGLNFTYQWDHDSRKHANRFFHSLDNAITTVQTDDLQNYLKFVKIYADARFSWSKVAAQWRNMIDELKSQYPTVESRSMQTNMFSYKIGG